jgi:predicted RNA-binding protein YlqC (UPF0109 family)
MQNDAVLEYLEMTIKALVDKSDDVKIVKTIDEMGVLMTVDVNADDMGKLIGRQGATAKSIRTLLRVVGMKHNQRVNMKINEPLGRRAHGGASADVDAAIADLKSDM